MKKPNVIVCAACKLSNGLILAGVRHWDKVMADQAIAFDDLKGITGEEVQGFLDKNGEFHDRKEAFKIAKAAGQIKQKTDHPNSVILYSEDLY